MQSLYIFWNWKKKSQESCIGFFAVHFWKSSIVQLNAEHWFSFSVLYLPSLWSLKDTDSKNRKLWNDNRENGKKNSLFKEILNSHPLPRDIIIRI
jgi:hypothetical protein